MSSRIFAVICTVPRHVDKKLMLLEMYAILQERQWRRACQVQLWRARVEIALIAFVLPAAHLQVVEVSSFPPKVNPHPPFQGGVFIGPKYRNVLWEVHGVEGRRAPCFAGQDKNRYSSELIFLGTRPIWNWYGRKSGFTFRAVAMLSQLCLTICDFKGNPWQGWEKFHSGG